jgi:hypothetical protein
MRPAILIAVLFTALAAACSGKYPVFEDRSDQVKIEHRNPSK